MHTQALEITTLILKTATEETYTTISLEQELLLKSTKILKIKLVHGIIDYYIDVGNYQEAMCSLINLRNLMNIINKEDPSFVFISINDCDFLEAKLLRLKGLYNESYSLIKIVRNNYKTQYGQKHPKIISSLNLLCEIQLLLCYHKRAIRTNEQANNMCIKFFTPTHPFILKITYIKCLLTNALGNYISNIDITIELIRKLKGMYNNYHPLISDCFTVLGEATRLLGNPRGAQKFYDECLVIRKKLFPFEVISIDYTDKTYNKDSDNGSNKNGNTNNNSNNFTDNSSKNNTNKNTDNDITMNSNSTNIININNNNANNNTTETIHTITTTDTNNDSEENLINSKMKNKEANTIITENNEINDSSDYYLNISLCELLYMIGMNFVSKGLYLKAINIYKKVIQLYKLLLINLNVNSHVNLDMCRINLSYLYFLTGKYENGKRLFSGYKSIIDVVGMNHIYTSEIFYIFSIYKQINGQYSDSNVLLQYSKNIVINLLDRNHPSIINIILAECNNYRLIGYFPACSLLLDGLLVLGKEIYQIDSVFLGFILYARAQLLRDIGEWGVFVYDCVCGCFLKFVCVRGFVCKC